MKTMYLIFKLMEKNTWLLILKFLQPSLISISTSTDGRVLARSEWKPPGKGCPCFSHEEEEQLLPPAAKVLAGLQPSPPCPFHHLGTELESQHTKGLLSHQSHP